MCNKFIFTRNFQLLAETSIAHVENLANGTIANIGLTNVANNIVVYVAQKEVSESKLCTVKILYMNSSC